MGNMHKGRNRYRVGFTIALRRTCRTWRATSGISQSAGCNAWCIGRSANMCYNAL